VRKRSTIATILIVLLVTLVAIFAMHGAFAKENPPGCKNEVPGPNGFKNPNCTPEGPEFGNCNDGIDNDGDGKIDGEDPDCQTPPTQEGPPGDATCSDGIDNDQDGDTDGADSDCQTPPTTEGPAGDPTCSDGIDNDQDGDTDGADSDCQTPPPPPACSDGIDNDEDGFTDGDDPGCENPEDNDETDPVTAQNCTADAGDPGLLTEDTLAKTAWDGGLDALAPLTENPKRNGVISGPLGDAFQPPDGPLAALEVVGDEATCLLDLLLDEDVSPIDP
jgi:hypothetical protein